jgi:GNAT superfamily N-acetyltransferase
MTSPTEEQAIKTWTNGPYTISTDPTLIPLETLNTWFASDDFYWAKDLPPSALEQSLRNSLCFGLYYTPANDNDNSFVGIARCITDHVTFAYITDVYVHPSHQGKGLGRWLVKCIGEATEAMPHLRRSMLFTMDWERSVPFYEKVLGMEVAECKKGEGMAMMMRKGRGYPRSMDG